MKNIPNERERIKNPSIVEDILPLDKSVILITGVGISGKSTFRRTLFDYLKDKGKPVEHYDADNFKVIRHPLDELCLKQLPEKFDNKIYLIEDIHATLPKGAIMPLSNYDKIFYVHPDIKSHNIFWTQRMINWYENGTFSWEADTGWSGTGKKRDPANIEGIVNAYSHDMENREKWIKEDLDAISNYPYKIINSKWTKEGPVFS
jgi:hypothetical protein